MDFSESIKRQLDLAFGQTSAWDINPLVVIGLTEAVLGLGLTEDQVYSVIRSYGRQLAAQVHPDKKPLNFSPEQQKRIIQAFDYLDNRENFSKALADFRSIRAEDRRETKLLLQTIKVLRQRIEQFENAARQLPAERIAFEKLKSDFLRLKSEDPLVAPSLEAEIKDLKRKNSELDEKVTNLASLSYDHKHHFSNSASYISRLGTFREEECFAFDARWIMVASIWRNKAETPTPYDDNGKVTNKFFDAAFGAGADKVKIRKALSVWNSVVKLCSEKSITESAAYPIAVSILKKEMGTFNVVFGDRLVRNGGRVIGMIDPKNVQVGRRHLVHSVAWEDVFENMVPFLAPYGVLVSVVGNERLRAAWSITCPSFRFTTKRIIIAAG